MSQKDMQRSTSRLPECGWFRRTIFVRSQPLDSEIFFCPLTALLPWYIAPAFAAEAATQFVERTVEPRREAVQ
jgi:hypothetical protein